MLVRFDNGAKGSFSVGQVCAGHKNDLVLEVCGSKASVRWRQEHQNELWIGPPRRGRTRCCRRTRRCIDAGRARLRAPAGRPSGSVGRRVLQRDARHLRLHRRRAARIARCRRRSRRSKTAIAPTASSRRSSRAPRRAASGPRVSSVRRDEAIAMTIQPFAPKFMKVGVLTAALQELTPRDVRDADPDRAIEDWLAFARELGADYIQLSAALHPSRDRRAARGHARSGRQHAGPAAAVRRARAARVAGGDRGDRRRHLRPRLLRQPAAPRCRDAAEEARLHAARVRRGGAARRRTPCAGSSAATSSAAWTRTSSTSRSSSSRC